MIYFSFETAWNQVALESLDLRMYISKFIYSEEVRNCDYIAKYVVQKIIILNSPVCAVIFDGINLRRQMKCISFDKVNGIFNQRELQIKHHRK